MATSSSPSSISQHGTGHSGVKSDNAELRQSKPAKIPVILKSSDFALIETKYLFGRDMRFVNIRQFILQRIEIQSNDMVIFLVELADPKSQRPQYVAPNGDAEISFYDRGNGPVTIHLVKENGFGTG